MQYPGNTGFNNGKMQYPDNAGSSNPNTGEIKTPNNEGPGNSFADLKQPEELPFQLQPDEKIIRAVKPQKMGFILSRTAGSYVMVLGLIILMVVIFTIYNASLFRYLAEMGLAIAFLLLFALLLTIKPLISYGKFNYWVTTVRVIGQRGFLSYSVDSIPLENITDIIMIRTMLDRILGISSLIIVPMGSNSESNGGNANSKAQNPNYFPALPETVAPELQQTLFKLRNDLKKAPQIVNIERAKPPEVTPEDPKQIMVAK